MKLEVGMYVRYIPTIGEYTQKISKITKTKNCLLDMCYTLDDKEEVFSSHFDDILGASHNIIDLIEVGDIISFYEDIDNYKKQYVIGIPDLITLDEIKDKITNDNIRLVSVLTKEQMEQMAYKVEE